MGGDFCVGSHFIHFCVIERSAMIVSIRFVAFMLWFFFADTFIRLGYYSLCYNNQYEITRGVTATFTSKLSIIFHFLRRAGAARRCRLAGGDGLLGDLSENCERSSAASSSSSSSSSRG